MNHVSIFERKWLDLVFEGKNKEYGAYQLRRENPATTLKAFFIGTLLISALVMTLSSFRSAPTIAPEIIDEAITPVNLSDPFIPEPPKTDILPPAAPREDETPDNLPPEPAPIPDPEPPKNPAPGSPTTAPSGAATGPSGPTGPIVPSGTGTIPTPDPGPLPPAILDRQPRYPGGIDLFYRYVGDNFKNPDLDDVKAISVIVMFVIEKDGTMTDIKVARDPGYGLGKEAIRVLKSLKTKWEPGIKDGKPVRTAYTLPIKVYIQ